MKERLIELAMEECYTGEDDEIERSAGWQQEEISFSRCYERRAAETNGLFYAEGIFL